jgi:hypothetical protein
VSGLDIIRIMSRSNISVESLLSALVIGGALLFGGQRPGNGTSRAPNNRAPPTRDRKRLPHRISLRNSNISHIITILIVIHFSIVIEKCEVPLTRRLTENCSLIHGQPESSTNN